MSLNRKLTPLIAGRTVQATDYKDRLLDIHFSDGSNLRIKATAAPHFETWPERVIKTIRQKGTAMHIDFTDGTTAEPVLAESMSSVMLRDKAGVMEYAD